MEGLRKLGEKTAGGESSKKGTEGEKLKKKMLLNISQSKKLEKKWLEPGKH